MGFWLCFCHAEVFNFLSGEFSNFLFILDFVPLKDLLHSEITTKKKKFCCLLLVINGFMLLHFYILHLSTWNLP